MSLMEAGWLLSADAARDEEPPQGPARRWRGQLAALGVAAGLLGSAAVWIGHRAPQASSASIRGGGVLVRQEVVLSSASGETAEDLADAIDEEEASMCSAQGGSCLRSKCCMDAGLQCFTKDAWWAQCLPSCTPGPNVVDLASPAPWACKALGPRTPGEVKNCSADGEDCSVTRCCQTGGTQCFRKNQYWSTCLPQCTPGPNLRENDWRPWSCEALGPRAPGAAPWVSERCAKGGEPCADKGCCAEPGMQCFTQSPWYSKCRPACTPGAKDNAGDRPWECKAVGMRTPARADSAASAPGVVASWVGERCSAIGENCLESQCCQAVGHQCFRQSPYWAQCKPSCSREPDEGNRTWDCEPLGTRSWGLALKGYPSLYCTSLFMPSGYEGPLLKAHLKANAGIFQCDGYDVFAAEPCSLGSSQGGASVQAIQIPKIPVGVSQDGTAGNAKLFMAVWDKLIAHNRFLSFDFTLKVDPDAVLIPWRIRDHMRPHVGSNSYVVNCNKFPNSPNFPMMFGAVEIFSSQAMDAYARGSWKCGAQLPWKSWGEDYYMTHCLDFLGVGRIADFGVLGDNVCTGANCADQYKGSFHPFKSIDAWNQCWTQATASHK